MKTFLLLLLTFVFSTQESTGRVYTFGENPNVLAIPLQDSFDDFALRIEAIKRAKHSIDIITYMQTLDEHLGEEYVQAIEQAISRGVEVRFIMEWLPNSAVMGLKAGSPANRLLRHAFTSGTCSKLQVQCITPISKILAGFTPTDNFHEKALVIDSGTETESAFISGRNNNDFAARDLDFAVALRRTDPKKKSAISLLGHMFNDTWSETLHMQTPETELRGQNKKPVKFTPLAKKTSPKFETIKKCFITGEESPGLTFHPETMAVTTNNFFKQLRENDWLTLSRLGKMQSDNVDAVAKNIEKAKHIRMSLMSTFWPEKIKAALKVAVTRGAKIEIFTNSEESDRIAVPGAFSYLYSSRDLSDLRKWVDEYPGSELKINVLNLEKSKKFPEFWKRIQFVHQKMVLTDNAVHFGSDNYNVSSLLKNSEMQVIFTGTETAIFFNKHFDEISALFKPLECDALLTARKRSLNPFNRVMIRILRSLF